MCAFADIIHWHPIMSYNYLLIKLLQIFTELAISENGSYICTFFIYLMSQGLTIEGGLGVQDELFAFYTSQAARVNKAPRLSC